MWAKYVSILIGLWLMVAPTMFNYGSTAADNGHIIGPIIVTFSVISLWEATDSVHKWNYPFALWLLLAPWVLAYPETMAIIGNMMAGILLLVLASVKRIRKNRYGGGWAALLSSTPEHMEH